MSFSNSELGTRNFLEFRTPRSAIRAGERPQGNEQAGVEGPLRLRPQGEQPEDRAGKKEPDEHPQSAGLAEPAGQPPPFARVFKKPAASPQPVEAQ